MNISAWSIRNPVPALLLFFLLTVTGWLGFQRLDIQDFPDMDLPAIEINAVLEGAAPAQLETEVARKIEDKLASITRLDHVVTTISDGVVNIGVTFDVSKNIEQALSEVRNAVDSARAEMPAGMPEPSVTKVTTAGRAMLTYTVESTRLDEKDLSWFVDKDVSKALLAVRGVATVARVGGVDREVHVDLNPTLMSGLGITPSAISTQLRATQRDSSGGQGEVGGQRQSSRTIATVGTAADIAALAIPLADGRYVRLDQVARITDSHAERSTVAFRDGRPVVGFQVTRARGFSDVGVAEGVRAAMQRFAQEHPEVKITEATNAVEPIAENYRGSMHLLLEGALLAIVVVWCFLRDWRSTFVSAAALPLSIIPTFGFMALAGYSLNVVTLLALSLVVGVLVDDAIVEIENIARHLRMGKTPYQAAMDATNEIGLAVIATTFTLVAVFLPTAFMAGIPGKIFRQFGMTASVAVLASLLVARLLTPMMAAHLLKPVDAFGREEAPEGRVMTRYLGWVRKALRRRRATALAAAGFFGVSIVVLGLLPGGFMPPQDVAQSRVMITLPPGSTLEQTAETSARAVQLLRTLPEVKSVFVAAGTAALAGLGPGPGADVATAMITADLVPRGERRRKQVEVEEQMRRVLRAVPGARVSVLGNGGDESLTITLAGDDPQVLSVTAGLVESQLRGLKGIGNVTSSTALQRPEIQVRPDMARAAALGVTSEALADAIRLATYGDYSAALPKLNLPQRQVPIRVRMDPAVRGDLEALSHLRVPGGQGTVTLGSVASLSIGSGLAQINRLDRSRNVTLTVELAGRAIGEVQEQVESLPALRNLPPGVRLVEQGELQRMAELFQSFGLAMVVGIVCIYAVLVLLFHDFLQPATILSALPLALGGAVFALWVSQQAFSLPVVIGVLMLMGIVTKNSILLVEYAIMARRNLDMDRFDALIDACRKRARPIVMTTAAMAAGMLPNALGLGTEPSFRQPMAIVVIGGLLTSTLLSLMVVPVVFTYVDDLMQWGRRRYLPQYAMTEFVSKWD